MIINKIKLVNFKNFDTVEVHLNPMNVIVGANASGKSNFIQALKFLRDIKDFGIENALSLHGGVEYFKNLLLKNKKKTIISIEYQSFHEVYPKLYADKLIISDKYTYSIEISNFINNGKLYSIREQWIYHVDLKNQEITDNGISKNSDSFEFIFNAKNGDIEIIIPNKNELVIKLPNNELLAVSKNAFYPLAFIDKKSTKMLLEQLEIYFPIQELSIYDFDLKKAKSSTPITGKADLEENGENLAIVLRNILKDKEKSRQFSNLMKDMLPFIKQLDIDKFYDKSLLFKVKEIYNHNTFIPSALLSDGTISVTAIVVALFFQNKNLAIFEEPEHGLHPALIAQLMQLFYSAAEEKQIIVTTHNPEVLKHTRLEDLLLVSRNEKGFAVITKPAEQTMVKAFLENELGIDQLFIQNLLDA
jgi:predicted ATPase